MLSNDDRQGKAAAWCRDEDKVIKDFQDVYDMHTSELFGDLVPFTAGKAKTILKEMSDKENCWSKQNVVLHDGIRTTVRINKV